MYEHLDFINFAEKNRLQLLQWDQGLGGVVTELIPLGGLYDYTFRADNLLQFTKTGETLSLNIVSTKVLKSGGSPISVKATITSISGEGFSIAENGNEIVAVNNASSTTRTGKVVITQEESGKVVNVDLSQVGV